MIFKVMILSLCVNFVLIITIGLTLRRLSIVIEEGEGLKLEKRLDKALEYYKNTYSSKDNFYYKVGENYELSEISKENYEKFVNKDRQNKRRKKCLTTKTN